MHLNRTPGLSSSKEQFHFKQFSVAQDRCAMKIGTDGVLLGGWTSVDHSPDSILDIGAGTGLIALMLAQKSTAETIDAVEIDEAAYEQCVENFEASPWGDRLFCYYAGLEEFVDEWDEKYDLIVSNPPFFEPTSIGDYTAFDANGHKTSQQGKNRKKESGGEELAERFEVESLESSRKTARFYDSLPFGALLAGVSGLLSGKGIFTTIIPDPEEKQFLVLALEQGLYPQKITRVKGNPASKIKRSLLALGFEKMEVATDELVIELKRHEYTPEYRALTEDFYLKM